MAEIIDRRFPRIVTTDSQNNSDIGGGGGGSGDIVKVSIVLNMEDPTASYLDITAKELFELFQAGKIVYVKGSFTYSEPSGYTEIACISSPITSAGKNVSPEYGNSYEFYLMVQTNSTVFTANADDDKPVMQS